MSDGRGEHLLWRGPRLGDLAADPHNDCRVNFEAGDEVWHLVVASGAVRPGDGPAADPDVTLRWSSDDAAAIARGSLSGGEALRRTTAIAPAADGMYIGPPAPLDLGCRPELEALPRIPGATVTVQYRYRRGPFGDMSYVLSFIDGRFDREDLDECVAADVKVDVTYRAMVAVRAGEMTILDALVDGTVAGDEGAMGVLAGISESREFHAVELATGRHGFALASLGELRSQLVGHQVGTSDDR